MRAIVTGSAGFIGSHLVRELDARGWDVLGIDQKTGKSIEYIDAMTRSVVVGEDCDAIFHLASPVGPVGVLGEAGRIVSQVIETTDIVRRWAVPLDAVLIDVSSSEVYGSGHADSEDDPCTFGSGTSARKEYAVAKLAAETMLRNDTDLDVRIVRPFNVAGPGQLADGGFVIPRFVEQALRDEPLTVYRPGTQLRAFTHVADVVDGLIRAYEYGTRGRVYNLGNPANACTITALAHEVIAATGSDSTIRLVDPVELHGPAFREAPDKLPVADRAHDELGWIPLRDRATIIRDAIADRRFADSVRMFERTLS